MKKLKTLVATPLTPFEASTSSNPAWDSIAQIGTYLTALDSSRANVSVLVKGKSVQGRNLYAIKVNMPTLAVDAIPLNVPMYVAGQHAGTEQAPVEAALTLAREWADLRTEPLVVLPLVNPDGYYNKSRFNAHGVDINRNQVKAYLGAGEPESEFVQKVIGDYGINSLVDGHETDGSHGTGMVQELDLVHWPYGTTAVKDLSVLMNNAARSAAQAASWTTSLYTFDPIKNPGTLGEAATRYRNAASMTIETLGNGKQSKGLRFQQHLVTTRAALLSAY